MSETSGTFLPLSVPVLAGHEWEYVKDCLDSGWVSSAGSYVERFEDRLCALVGAPHAVALVNGTAGLHMALLAAGVCPGDRVVVPALTFIATANAVRHAGAEPVFVDCDEFMNIDVEGVRSFLAEACEPERASSPIPPSLLHSSPPQCPGRCAQQRQAGQERRNWQCGAL